MLAERGGLGGGDAHAAGGEGPRRTGPHMRLMPGSRPGSCTQYPLVLPGTDGASCLASLFQSAEARHFVPVSQHVESHKSWRRP